MFIFDNFGVSEKWMKRQIAKAKENEGKLTKEQKKSLIKMIESKIKKAREERKINYN